VRRDRVSCYGKLCLDGQCCTQPRSPISARGSRRRVVRHAAWRVVTRSTPCARPAAIARMPVGRKPIASGASGSAGRALRGDPSRSLRPDRPTYAARGSFSASLPLGAVAVSTVILPRRAMCHEHTDDAVRSPDFRGFPRTRLYSAGKLCCDALCGQRGRTKP
jgi:hypothetical protein